MLLSGSCFPDVVVALAAMDVWQAASGVNVSLVCVFGRRVEAGRGIGLNPGRYEMF